MKSMVKTFALILFMGAILFPVYAFASSNTGPGSAGEAAGPISGWAVSNVSYQLALDPSQVKNVSFDLDAPAGYVSVKLVSNSTDFSTCANMGGFHWQCDLHAKVNVSSMDEFRVIATGN